MGTICFSVISLNRSLHSCPLSLSVEPFRSDRLWLLLFHVWDACGNLKGDSLDSWPCRSLPPAEIVGPQHWGHLGTFWRCRLSGPIQIYWVRIYLLTRSPGDLCMYPRVRGVFLPSLWGSIGCGTQVAVLKIPQVIPRGARVENHCFKFSEGLQNVKSKAQKGLQATLA